MLGEPNKAPRILLDNIRPRFSASPKPPEKPFVPTRRDPRYKGIPVLGFRRVKI